MRALIVIVVALLVSGVAHAQRPPAAAPAPLPPPAALPPQAPAQAPPTAAPARSCQSQHIEQPGVSAAALIARGYDIKAAIPGGLWVQKDREVFFCNSGLALDSDVICWRLREPVKGQPC